MTGPTEDAGVARVRDAADAAGVHRDWIGRKVPRGLVFISFESGHSVPIAALARLAENLGVSPWSLSVEFNYAWAGDPGECIIRIPGTEERRPDPELPERKDLSEIYKWEATNDGENWVHSG